MIIIMTDTFWFYYVIVILNNLHRLRGIVLLSIPLQRHDKCPKVLKNTLRPPSAGVTHSVSPRACTSWKQSWDEALSPEHRCLSEHPRWPQLVQLPIFKEKLLGYFYVKSLYFKFLRNNSKSVTWHTVKGVPQPTHPWAGLSLWATGCLSLQRITA